MTRREVIAAALGAVGIKGNAGATEVGPDAKIIILQLQPGLCDENTTIDRDGIVTEFNKAFDAAGLPRPELVLLQGLTATVITSPQEK